MEADINAVPLARLDVAEMRSSGYPFVYRTMVPGATLNALQMHIDHPNTKNLPVQKVHDVTFVFADSDTAICRAHN